VAGFFVGKALSFSFEQEKLTENLRPSMKNSMIDLDSDRWGKLEHAYGSAADTPELLKQAAKLPVITDWQTDPYFSLWSSLCHQGDSYTASYAAVPHIISICRSNLSQANESLFQLVVCIEISRLTNHGPSIPTDIQEVYFKAIAELPNLIATLHTEKPSEGLTIIGSAALAINSGHGILAQAFLEMSSETAPKFLEWFFEN